MSQPDTPDNADEIEVGEYADLVPDMSDREYEALKRSISKHGLDDPIKVTPDGVVVDGHHRLKACRELGVDPKTERTDPDSERAARANLARRDLSQGGKREAVKRYLTKHYEGERAQQEVADDLGVAQSTVSEAWEIIDRDRFPRDEKRRRVREFIDQHPEASNRDVSDAVEPDVSYRTVGNWRNEWADDVAGDTDKPDTDDTDQERADDTDAAPRIAPEAAESAPESDSEDSTPPKELTDGDDGDDEHTVVDAATKQETDEWSSPRKLVEPLAETVGGFDLDPCSGAESSPFAAETYTEADDGLEQPWYGTVWVNPPYSEMADWTAKAVAEAGREATDAIYYLCKGDSSTDWWHEALPAASVVVAIDRRLSFGDGGNSAPFPSHIFVFGAPDDATLRELSTHGAVLTRLGTDDRGGAV